MSTTPSGPTNVPVAGAIPVVVDQSGQPSKMAAFLGYVVRGRRRPGEVVVVSHSDLFYWWPVWLVGFIMSGVTYFHDTHMGFIHGEPQLVRIKGTINYVVLDEPRDRETPKPAREFVRDHRQRPKEQRRRRQQGP